VKKGIEMNVEHAAEVGCETWSLATRSGMTVCTPPSMRSLTTYVLLEQERWFEAEISLLPLLLKPGMNALDIGANHGVYALEMARCTQNGHVWAFEPTQAPRANLLRSVTANVLEHQITVVPVGLADCAGQASFAVGENSELNSRGGAGDVRETVQLESLDAYLAEHAPGVAISFIKMDAEGGELLVLAGARRLFETQSPVVLFELKHGASMNTGLIERFCSMGYDLFRWSAELRLLLPFDSSSDEINFALNLVAVRPQQQAELAARGVLVTGAALQIVAEPTPEPQSLLAWCNLSGQSLEDLKLESPAVDGAYLRALNSVASAYLQPDLSPAERVSLMVSARVTLVPALDSAQGMGVEGWSLLVHTLFALGQQYAAVQLAGQVLARWPQDQAVRLPVVPPQLSDLDRPRTTPMASWLRQVLSEFTAMRSSYSSYFAQPAPELWSRLLDHPDHSAEVERRYMLSHMIQDRVAPVDKLTRLPGDESSCNTLMWRALLQASRAMARDEANCPATQASRAEALLADLPVKAVNIVDVGASSLGNESEPYTPLVRAGRARITGFEPDKQALLHLQREFPNPMTHRFMPHFVGSGQPAVFHETQWALTASLFEPNRRILDHYQRLGELVIEKARHEVQTARLDDMLAPGEMDVLKIDVQGAERLVFDGAAQRLDECLVVWTEVEFIPLYKNQPLFGDIDARLRSHGLQFLCFAGLSDRSLASWPKTGARRPMRPQQLWADAIYVPQPERIEALTADAAARLALAAHHMLGAYDLCHAALLRYDEVTGDDFSARYVMTMEGS
jgi:protein O-GlcNAc transferase